MKNIILIILCLSALGLSAQEFSMSPEKPEIGDKLSLHYTIGDGILKGEDIHALIYTLRFGEDPVASEVELTESGEALVGSFTLEKNADALLIKFVNSDETIMEYNDKNGYQILLYKNGTVIKESNAALAEAISVNFRKVIIEQQPEVAKSYLDNEIKSDPSIRRNIHVQKMQALIARSTEDEKSRLLIIKDLEKVKDNNSSSEQALMDASEIAMLAGSRDLKDQIITIAASNFPEGKAAMQLLSDAFFDAKTMDEKLKLYDKYSQSTKGNSEYATNLDYMSSTLAKQYMDDNDQKNFIVYADKIQSPTAKASLYNNVAWDLSGESHTAEPVDAKLGEQLSKKSLHLIETEKENMTKRPIYQSESRYANNMNYNYAMYSDTYALLAHHLGMKADALKYQTLAVEAYDYEDGEMNTRYAIYMEDAEGGTAVMPFIEKMMSAGKAGSEMKEQYKRIFKETMSIDMAHDKVAALLEKEAKAKHMEEIKKSLYRETPKDFSLVTLEGKKVSLADMKGKVVILDFWATWCGPCKASFPGMQKAVDKYADNENVEFLFVDTWESADDKEANAKKFLDSKGYRFNVLMDNENAMVQNYGIGGIPTKFILDQAGNIRYKSVGYDGNDAKLVDEISMVIEVLMSEKDNASVQP